MPILYLFAFSCRLKSEDLEYVPHVQMCGQNKSALKCPLLLLCIPSCSFPSLQNFPVSGSVLTFFTSPLTFILCCSLIPIPETPLCKLTFIFKLSNSMIVYVFILFDLMVAFDTVPTSSLKLTLAWVIPPLSTCPPPSLTIFHLLHAGSSNDASAMLPSLFRAWFFVLCSSSHICPHRLAMFKSLLSFSDHLWPSASDSLFSAQTSLLGFGPANSVLYLAFLPEHCLLTPYSTWIKIPSPSVFSYLKA